MSIIPTTVKSKELVEKRREQIVRAAIKLFAQKGFHKTTLRELADEAGISHGNIYDYVGSKEDIFFLIHEFMADLADASLARSTRDIDDPLEKLRRMVRSEFNFMYQWADAILLIYQESHILGKPLLKRFLQREREHVSKFEQVLQECVERGVCRYVNYRVLGNLIKIMTDSWVLKRWDLREHVAQLEMEKCILDLVFHGVVMDSDSEPERPKDMEALGRKSALLINGGTFLGKAISSFLFSKGLKLAVHGYGLKNDRKSPVSQGESAKGIRLFPVEEYGPMNGSLLKHIISEFGPLDIVIFDLGISNATMTTLTKKKPLAGQRLEGSLHSAQDIALSVEEEMGKRGSGRVVFLAPWAWDRYLDPLRYQTVKAGTISLTQTMAKRMAASRVNVNCIVPGFIGGPRPLSIEKEMGAESVKDIPLGYLGEVSDVTESVLFLISDSSKYVTSHILKVDGGIDQHLI